MDASATIRDSMQAVARLRESVAADPRLQSALRDVKRLQARRFRGTYADLLRSPVYSAPADFFLRELYGEQDYSRRDDQFSRIAGAIERLFPAQVAQTAASLAHLHALTEDLDVQMARMWPDGQDSTAAARYARAWRTLGRREERLQQLQSVAALGHDLVRLTRTPGLRTMLKLMRAPAAAAGLADLQRFLETGFDTFAGMARRSGAAEHFLATVEQRERALMELLDEADDVACETELARILGQAP